MNVHTMNEKMGAALLIVQGSIHARLIVPTSVKVVRHEIQFVGWAISRGIKSCTQRAHASLSRQFADWLSMIDGPHGSAAVRPYYLPVSSSSPSNAARTSSKRRLKLAVLAGVPE